VYHKSHFKTHNPPPNHPPLLRSLLTASQLFAAGSTGSRDSSAHAWYLFLSQPVLEEARLRRFGSELPFSTRRLIASSLWRRDMTLQNDLWRLSALVAWDSQGQKCECSSVQHNVEPVQRQYQHIRRRQRRCRTSVVQCEYYVHIDRSHEFTRTSN